MLFYFYFGYVIVYIETIIFFLLNGLKLTINAFLFFSLFLVFCLAVAIISSILLKKTVVFILFLFCWAQI